MKDKKQNKKTKRISDEHAPVGLLNGLLDSFNIKRSDTSQVDDLRLDTLFRELVRCLHTVGDHLAVCYDRHVASLTLDLGLANGQQEVVREHLIGHWEAHTIHHLILEEDDGVGIPDSCLFT